MSPVTREQKLASFKGLSKIPGVKTGTEFADSLNTVRLILGDKLANFLQIGNSGLGQIKVAISSFQLAHILVGI